MAIGWRAHTWLSTSEVILLRLEKEESISPLSLRTGLFFDNFGGIKFGQILHICGKSGSGKTILSAYLAMKFLDEEPGGKAIYFDSDKSLNKFDLQKLCTANLLNPNILESLIVTIPKDWKEIIAEINKVVEDHDGVIVVIDSLPNIFIGEQKRLLREPRQKRSREEIRKYLDSMVTFLIRTREILSKHPNLLIIMVNQVRNIIKTATPKYWSEKGYMPAAWNIIQGFIDTCILLEKIRRGLIYTRIVYSYHMPETIGIIRIGKNLQIE